ncbi:MAG: phosphotransferase enzyme family protein [Micromonosporaceae bacterium]
MAAPTRIGEHRAVELARVRQRLADHWGADVPVAALYVAHHERVVFQTVDPDGTRVVVKADVADDRLAREAAVLGAAGDAIAVPEVRVHLPGVMVMSWIGGTPLASDSPDADWTAVGRALRRLHDGVPTEGFPRFAGAESWSGFFRGWLPAERARCASRGLWPDDVLDTLFQTAAAASGAGIGDDGAHDGGEPPIRLLHGDSSTIHWRIGPDGTAAAIDFGDHCVGDPLWDLVVLTHWDDARLPAVLEGYAAGPATRRRLDRLYEPYRVVRHLLAIEWLLDHGYDPAPTVDELARLAVSSATPAAG